MARLPDAAWYPSATELAGSCQSRPYADNETGPFVLA